MYLIAKLQNVWFGVSISQGVFHDCKYWHFLDVISMLMLSQGDCQHPEDLIKAGVKKAKQVVVMR